MELARGPEEKQSHRGQGEAAPLLLPSGRPATFESRVIQFSPPWKYAGADLCGIQSKVPCRSLRVWQQRVPAKRPVCHDRLTYIDRALPASILLSLYKMNEHF